MVPKPLAALLGFRMKKKKIKRVRKIGFWQKVRLNIVYRIITGIIWITLYVVFDNSWAFCRWVKAVNYDFQNYF